MSRDTLGRIVIGAALAAGVAATLAARHLRTKFDDVFEEVARARGVDSNLLRAIAQVESGMNERAVSPKNANGTRDYGLMQINERTALGYGVAASTLVGNAKLSVDVAARLLTDMRRSLGERYTVPALISSYNQGVGGFLKRGIAGNADYVARVSHHHFLFTLGGLFRESA